MAETERFSPERGRQRRRDSMDQPPTAFRLVLVGKTGAGKSSCGNTILGREGFREAVGHTSVTNGCTKQEDKVFGRTVAVVDTPGLFDTVQDEDTVKREVSKCINMSAPGPHAILLVIRAGVFSAEERDTVRKVEEIFGEDAWRYTILLFSHGDKVNWNFDLKLEDAGDELQEILKKARHRYHVFNNVKANDRGQVLDLLEKVEKMVSVNGGQFYSNPTYLQVVEMLDQRESELREIYHKKLEEEIKAVEIKYEKKVAEARQERQEVEKRLKSELEEVKRYYHVLDRGVRQVVEQMTRDDPLDQIAIKLYEKLKLN